MNVQDHLRKYPNTRASTLVYLQTRDAKTEQLKAELEAEKRREAKPIIDVRALITRIRKLTLKA